MASTARCVGSHSTVLITGAYSKRDAHTYLSYVAPGRQISRFALREDRTGFLFVFARPNKESGFAEDIASQKRTLVETFSQEPWVEWPRSRAISKLLTISISTR